MHSGMTDREVFHEMYNCGAELGKGDNCQNCGTNVKYTKDFDGI